MVPVRRVHLLIALLVLIVALLLRRPYVDPLMDPVRRVLLGGKTIADRLEEFGADARERMRPGFAQAGVAYPPKVVTLVGIKSERTLTVCAGPSRDALSAIIDYPVLGQSGVLGPKLREGDLQVPEGLYRIESLNPNSSFHVSLRVNYPNDFDWEKAGKDGRDEPGSDIFIHGQRASVGCLAMGNPAAEELFTLAADVGVENFQLIISPIDFRAEGPHEDLPDTPPWLPELYAQIKAALQTLPGKR